MVITQLNRYTNICFYKYAHNSGLTGSPDMTLCAVQYSPVRARSPVCIGRRGDGETDDLESLIDGTSDIKMQSRDTIWQEVCHVSVEAVQEALNQ